tara:strand:+ start:1833 stop:2663 length:831 start_codon:yes stop_codon:yes gene_type:complete
MGGPSATVSKNHPRPGSIVFSTSREITENTQVYSRLFRCRKNKFDFIGQIKINLQEIAANVEVFNTNYFDCFDTPLKNVTLVLKNTLFTKLLSEKNLPERLREAILSLLNKKDAKKKSSALDFINGRKVNLKEIFDKLNTEYFESKITASIEWGKKVNKKNLTSFRFGSYDPEKKLIRIHPRLQQYFVPLSVLELTVYHEMCHQWAPMKRKKGMWVAHHPQFKRKEREYCFYDEALSWEKKNWKKLMGPTSKKNIKSKTGSPIKQNGTLEITTLAG